MEEKRKMKIKEKKGICKATAVLCAVSGRHLSRQPRWRDKDVPSRHRDTNAGHSELSETTAQQNALVAPMAVARQRGATGVYTSFACVARAAARCQRGGSVTPPELARQRLIVAPVGMARPNGLWRGNKMTTGLNLKYYLKN